MTTQIEHRGSSSTVHVPPGEHWPDGLEIEILADAGEVKIRSRNTAADVTGSPGSFVTIQFTPVDR